MLASRKVMLQTLLEFLPPCLFALATSQILEGSNYGPSSFVYVINISWWERQAYVVLLHGNKAYFFPWLSSFHAVGNDLLDGDVGGLSLSKLITLSLSHSPPYHKKVLFTSKKRNKLF
jgi:hypothetical protein